MINFYKLKDHDRKKSDGMYYMPQDKKLLQEENKKGNGIFWSVNSFKSTNRVMSELESFENLFVEIDTDNKKKTLDRILTRGLPPTVIIETKNGYHVYFSLKKAPLPSVNSISDYRSAIRDRLNPFYGGDNNAIDVCRVLRASGYYHMKDPSDPFLIKIIFGNIENRYTFEEVINSYPNKNKKPYIPKAKRKVYSEGNSDEVMSQLEKLSGTKYINHDQLSFRKNANGTYQIWANGKPTPNWIDGKGGIGNCGYIWQYLEWYGNDKEKIKSILRELKL